MIVRRVVLHAVLLGVAALQGIAVAADKPVPPATAGNENLDLTGSAIVDKTAVAARLGADPGAELIIIDVKFSPRGDNNLTVSRDDFLLLSRKDGQRSQPLHPSQIAGGAALVVANSGRGGVGGGLLSQRRGPIWGGAPGTGDRPRRIGGDEDAIVGGAGGEAAQTSVKTDAKEENPVLRTLKEKELPQKKTNEAVSGLLYFFLEGKHKLKDLELMYKGSAGALTLDFVK